MVSYKHNAYNLECPEIALQLPAVYTKLIITVLLMAQATLSRALMNKTGWLLIFAITIASAARAAGPYVLTDLGNTVGGAHTRYAFGINSYGQVVGQTDVGTGSAFLWTPTTPNGTSGELLDLGTVWEASAINDYGQVIGCYYCNPSPPTASSLWTPTVANGTVGAWTSLPGPPSTIFDRSFGAAKAINATGQIVGTSSFSSGERASLWSPTVPNGTDGSAVSLGVAPSQNDSQGRGINSHGQVVGTGNAESGSPNRRAILWSPTTPNGASGSWVTLLNVDSYGWDINATGQVTGTNNSTGIAFLWNPTTPNGTSGTVSDLGRLPGSSRADPISINSNGSIVGLSIGKTNRAFLWEPNVPNGATGIMTDLNTLISTSDAAHWQLSTARGINDRGQIVGWGTFDADGSGGLAPVTRGYLLTPSIAGDFNGSGSVDAADYALWRHSNGSAADYELWRAHFGESILTSGTSLTRSASVPEPYSLALALGTGAILCTLLGNRQS